jgi:uncharacterized protein
MKPSLDVPDGALLPFFLLTFFVAWGFIVLLAMMPPPLESLLGSPGASHPLFILAVWTPALVALPLVALTADAGALRRYLSRLLLWRASRGWYAFLLLGVPAIFFAGAALGGGLPGGLEYLEPVKLLKAAGLMLVLGPFEEFGWRGVALPLLQRRMAPLWAGLVLGLIWGLWHLPAFFLSGTPQSGWDFMPFFVGATAASVILTPLFNHARGSILLAALFHFQLSNPVWPDAQPFDMYLFAAVAVCVVWFQRASMFDRGAGITEVVPRRRCTTGLDEVTQFSVPARLRVEADTGKG